MIIFDFASFAGICFEFGLRPPQSEDQIMQHEQSSEVMNHSSKSILLGRINITYLCNVICTCTLSTHEGRLYYGCTHQTPEVQYLTGAVADSSLEAAAPPSALPELKGFRVMVAPQVWTQTHSFTDDRDFGIH